MNTAFGQTATFSVTTETESNGDITTAVTTYDVRCHVRQIDGSRFVSSAELVDKDVYEIKCWDFSLGNNLKITWDGIDLYPIKFLRSPGTSNTKELTIIAVNKHG